MTERMSHFLSPHPRLGFPAATGNPRGREGPRNAPSGAAQAGAVDTVRPRPSPPPRPAPRSFSRAPSPGRSLSRPRGAAPDPPRSA